MQIWIPLLFLLLCIGLAPTTAAAAAEGITLAVQVAVPSLFPFFLASNLMTTSGSVHALGRWLAPLFAKVYRLPTAAAGVFLLSITGGYPVGAQATAQLYQQGTLTRAQANHLLTFANNTGPAFFVGLCGGILGSTAQGLWLYGVHVTAALAVGWLLRDRHAAPLGAQQNAPTQTAPLLPCLLQSVEQAGATALRVSAFIVAFVVLRSILTEIGALSLLAALLTPLCWVLDCPPQTSFALASGLLEVTNGLYALPASGNLRAAMGFLVSFGGLSVWAQSAAMLEGTDLSRARMVLGMAAKAAVAVIVITATAAIEN